jgi:hypothetical protein
MALGDYVPPIHTSKNNEKWQLVDMRLKRRPSDEHWTIEVGEGNNGVFGRVDGDDELKAFLARVIDRVAKVA